METIDPTVLKTKDYIREARTEHQQKRIAPIARALIKGSLMGPAFTNLHIHAWCGSSVKSMLIV